MSKIENIKQIVCNIISENSDGAEWGMIREAVSARYNIKDWVKEVRNPMQSLINMNVIERTDNIFEEVYIFTAFTKEIMAEMA